MRISVRKCFSGFLSLMMAVVMLLSLAPMAFAAEAEDSATDSGTASFKATYAIQDAPQEGVTFRVYKIADYRGGALFTWTETFAQYGITIPDFSSTAEVSALRETLTGYISRDSITPVATITTDEDGVITLPSIDLGMYIVIGDSTTTWDYVYRPVPFIVFVPFTAEDDTISTDVDVEVKVTETPVEITYVDRHVIKVWNDSNYSGRPSNVDVQLLRNGEVVSTITLSAANNWRHTWENLDSRYSWTCVESAVPSGYTTSTSLQGLTYTIINTRPYIPTTPSTPTLPPPLVDVDDPGVNIPDGIPILAEYPFDPDEPDDNDVPDNPPDVPDDPDDTDIPDNDVPKDENIPQTGQLQWPIPILGAVGAALIIFGLIPSKKKERD